MPSREYLEAILERAREHLPPWLMSEIHRAALPKAGGRASWRGADVSDVEAMALRQLRPKMLRAAKDDELKALWSKLGQWHARATRRKEDAGAFEAAASHVLQEMQGRGLEATGKLAEAAVAKSTLAARLEELPEVVVVEREAVQLVVCKDGGLKIQAEGNAGGWCETPAVDALAEVGVCTDETFGVHENAAPLYDLALVRHEPEPIEKAEPPPLAEWLEKADEVFVEKMIRHEPGEAKPWALYTRDGSRLLGRHATREEAEAQERVILDQQQPEEKTIRVLCSAAEKQIIYYLVSEPGTVDAHGHRITEEAIEDAMHGYMANSREIKLEHKTKITGRAIVVEGYIAPCDLTEFHGQKPPDGPIKKGSSIVGIHYTDSALWRELKNTEHGISWGGLARQVTR